MYYDKRTTIPFIIAFLILSLVPYYPYIIGYMFELTYDNGIFWVSLIALYSGEYFVPKMLLWFLIEYIILIILSTIIALSYVKLKYGKIRRK